jgi:predicted transglutaminase-like cysteine proteinase
MGLLGPARAWRYAVRMCGLTWFALATGSSAGALAAPGIVEPAAVFTAEAAEPFGVSASVVSAGGLRTKWLGVSQRIDDERVQLALCDGDREHCASDAALKFLSIVDAAKARDGRARIGEINRAINLSIRPMSDLAQHGEIDVWSSPLMTLASGAGDCEDYAIAKFVALRLAGVAAQDLRIVVMRDTVQDEDHAVTAARLDGQWLMLDNRRMAMVDDIHVRNYRPLFVLDESAVMRYSGTPLPDPEAFPTAAISSPAGP